MDSVGGRAVRGIRARDELPPALATFGGVASARATQEIGSRPDAGLHRPRDAMWHLASSCALGALAVVLLVPIWWGIDARFSWDVDPIAPGPVLKAMAARFGPSWASSYAPLPYLVVGCAYAPMLALMRMTGELGHPSPSYPWGFVHPDAAMAALGMSSRLVSLALGLGIVAMAVRDARRRWTGARWVVPLLFLGSPTFAYYARTSNVDIHVLFWLWLGFHLLETPEPSRRRLAAASAAGALAVCCKEQSAPIAAVLVVGAMVRSLHGARTQPLARVGAAAGVALAAVLAYVVVWRLPWGAPGWLAHHRFVFTQARYPRAFPLSFAGMAALGGRCVSLLPLALGFPVLGAAIAGLATRGAPRGVRHRAAAVALYLAAFIGAIGYVYPRFLIYLLLPCVPLAGRGLDSLARRGSWIARWSGRALLASGLLGGPLVSLAMLADPRQEAERWIRHQCASPGVTIEIAGNPHFQARIPRGIAVLCARPDSLRRRPRGPIGDIVLFSSVDRAGFGGERAARGLGWGAFEHQCEPGWTRKVFRRPAVADWIGALPVAPTIEVYRRVAAPRATSHVRRTALEPAKKEDTGRKVRLSAETSPSVGQYATRPVPFSLRLSRPHGAETDTTRSVMRQPLARAAERSQAQFLLFFCLRSSKLAGRRVRHVVVNDRGSYPRPDSAEPASPDARPADCAGLCWRSPPSEHHARAARMPTTGQSGSKLLTH